jgi:hypothetical protein
MNRGFKRLEAILLVNITALHTAESGAIAPKLLVPTIRHDGIAPGEIANRDAVLRNNPPRVNERYRCC